MNIAAFSVNKKQKTADRLLFFIAKNGDNFRNFRNHFGFLRKVLLQPCGTPSAEILIQLGILPHLLLEAPDMVKYPFCAPPNSAGRSLRAAACACFFSAHIGEQPLLGEHHVGECVIGIR